MYHHNKKLVIILKDYYLKSIKGLIVIVFKLIINIPSKSGIKKNKLLLPGIVIKKIKVIQNIRNQDNCLVSIHLARNNNLKKIILYLSKHLWKKRKKRNCSKIRVRYLVLASSNNINNNW